jgi:hypothetical protein
LKSFISAKVCNVQGRKNPQRQAYIPAPGSLVPEQYTCQGGLATSSFSEEGGPAPIVAALSGLTLLCPSKCTIGNRRMQKMIPKAFENLFLKARNLHVIWLNSCKSLSQGALTDPEVLFRSAWHAICFSVLNCTNARC